MAFNGSANISTDDVPDRSELFWRSEFKDFPATVIPVLPLLYKQSTLETLKHNIDLACGELDSVSASAALALAWGLVLSQYTGIDDVFFFFGLGLKLESIEPSNKLIVLPFRLLVDPQELVTDAFCNTETKITDGSTFEVSSSQELSNFGGEIAAACQYMNILNIRQGQQKRPGGLQSTDTRKFPLVLNCETRTNGVDMESLADPSAICIELTRMRLH
ncbi:hypothetical protein N7517_006724 [Penicillium concentricum]|uniref:Condensation domain-containing protein n=1 Tax=Penicillium concentricum TaxID=293559 RepID=A0A9W9S9X6_9EURO|nr:uncharacterized protein N7517_006724 [Penicillium concentricum]KAJ5374718.1 hypothetical protein N7517_006724 [Penicillium concentricum]